MCNKLWQILLPAFLGGNVAIQAPFHIVIALLGDAQVGGTVIIIKQYIADHDIVFKVIP